MSVCAPRKALSQRYWDFIVTHGLGSDQIAQELSQDLEGLVARAEAAERVIAEDRRGYVCGELHHQCAFEGRATVAEARVEAAKAIMGEVPLRRDFKDDSSWELATIQWEMRLEVALGVGGVEEKKV